MLRSLEELRAINNDPGTFSENRCSGSEGANWKINPQGHPAGMRGNLKKKPNLKVPPAQAVKQQK